MYLVDAVYKPEPYEFPVLPPYRGAIYPPVLPGRQGHFDHLPIGSREFDVVHMYGVLRRVLDIWEDYLGAPTCWHFADSFPRLELIPFVHWDNAHAGYGFIETGYDTTETGLIRPHALNLDVLAHELGHIMVYSVVGIFSPGTMTAEYRGFHESMADLVALVSTLHFDSVVEHLLRTTSGNLYALNELNRIGELSDNEQIRTACNARKLSEFETGWRKPHDLGQPLTGALFDVFVDVFHARLLETGLITESLAKVTYEAAPAELDNPQVQRQFDAAYRGNHDAFRLALLEARDYLGTCLTRTWSSLDADHLRYSEVGNRFLEADQLLTGGRHGNGIRESFAWRDIGSAVVGPKLPETGKNGSAKPQLARNPQCTSPALQDPYAAGHDPPRAKRRTDGLLR